HPSLDPIPLGGPAREVGNPTGVQIVALAIDRVENLPVELPVANDRESERHRHQHADPIDPAIEALETQQCPFLKDRELGSFVKVDHCAGASCSSSGAASENLGCKENRANLAGQWPAPTMVVG